MLLWGSILEIEIRPRHAHEREHPFTQMVVAQHVHSSLLVAPWNLCVDRPVHNNSWQCERVNPHAWWKNNTRPDTADCGVWNKHTQRGRIWSCGSKGWNSPSNETWQPWQSSGWCVRIFPIKKSRTSIWTSPGNAKLPWWFSSSWFPPPAVLTRGSSLPAPCAHQLFAVLPLHLYRWHTHFHWFLCTLLSIKPCYSGGMGLRQTVKP